MPARAQADGTLRIISWNLNGTPEAGPMRERIRRIAAQIIARAPDVALFQEVWFEGDAALLADALAGHYLRVSDAPAVRSHALSPFTGFRAGGLLAFVATGGRYRTDGTSQFEQFSDTAAWYRVRERDGVAGKGVQHFLLHEGGRSLAILNVHLQAQYAGAGPGSLHRHVRSRQIDQVQALAQRLEQKAATVIAAGDLNTAPQEADLYRVLTAYWTDLTRAAHEVCRCGTHLGKLRADGTKAHGDRWIDYVLMRRPSRLDRHSANPQVAQVDLIRSKSANCRYSDHHGLDVVFSLN